MHVFQNHDPSVENTQDVFWGPIQGKSIGDFGIVIVNHRFGHYWASRVSPVFDLLSLFRHNSGDASQLWSLDPGFCQAVVQVAGAASGALFEKIARVENPSRADNHQTDQYGIITYNTTSKER